ncbi:Fc receptor-like protein 5 [Xenopus laevis]|uniref:Fc receptor-like protein 5 n=1 Tax=Xenopus laevis TaxID=8355 RepID=A0A8J1LKW5_XENLA|nr:Fc receptor-like protein 5 [Xenopus laevis]
MEMEQNDLILQAPPDVYEGDSLSLRCHCRTGYKTRNTVFYMDNKIIESPVSESELHIGRVDVSASGTYKCESEILNGDTTYGNYKTTSRYISVSELFSTPQITVDLYSWTEGNQINITCDTKLSPHRETTELQFVFYRNGHNVQGFSLSNQYGVPSAQLEDSGNYTCEVQTPTGSVRKRSNVMTVEIQDGNQTGAVQNTVRLVLSGVIFIIILCLLFYHKKTMAVTYSQETEENGGEIRNEGECSI